MDFVFHYIVKDSSTIVEFANTETNPKGRTTLKEVDEGPEDTGGRVGSCCVEDSDLSYMEKPL